MNKKRSFYVLMWDFNDDVLIHYDVMPYLRDCYKERVKMDKKYLRRKNCDTESKSYKKYYKTPATLDEFKEFIKAESMYQYWSRCQYEMIVHGWPVRKNDYKIDIHEQIMMNIDIISDIFLKETEEKKK